MGLKTFGLDMQQFNVAVRRVYPPGVWRLHFRWWNGEEREVHGGHFFTPDTPYEQLLKMKHPSTVFIMENADREECLLFIFDNQEARDKFASNICASFTGVLYG